MVLSKLVFFQKYTLENVMSDYKKVELHENILKFIAIIKQSKNEIIFIHDYASDGTLRQYLKQNSSKFNWYDKLRLAKQLVSAVKCLQDNNIVHLNLNSGKILVNKGDIKINIFQDQKTFPSIFEYIQYTDSQFLQNIETYKLNKSSDIYSIGVLLWEISSGIIPFKNELY
ncbi:13190_t:CDS:2, partial [Dentiscutata heterogama]